MNTHNLENVSFRDQHSDHFKFVLPNTKIPFHGKGFCETRLSRAGNIITSPVKSVDEKSFETVSGSKYNVISYSPDYIEFKTAILNQIPILETWGMTKVGSKFFLSGYTQGDSTQISGYIISQEGNYLTLDNGINYFIQWANNNNYFDIKLSKVFLNIPYDKNHFEYFDDFLCRPKLPLE